MNRPNSIIIFLAGLLLFLLGIWIWLVPAVVGNVIGVISFFVGLGVMAWTAGIRMGR